MSFADRRAALAARVRARELTVAPGVFDLVSARIADQAGFDALYMTGYGVSASRMGLPDAGLTSFADMVDQARRLAAATSRPLIADADTGFGGQAGTSSRIENYLGFPKGISGSDLARRATTQAKRLGAEILTRVTEAGIPLERFERITGWDIPYPYPAHEQVYLTGDEQLRERLIDLCAPLQRRSAW